MSPDHLMRCAIRPALDQLGLGGRAAEELVLGTAIVESRLQYLMQVGNGPAVGFWQMEPATHDDIYANFLQYRVPLRRSVTHFVVAPTPWSMAWNLRYGAAMCRLQYFRRPEALPADGDLAGQADYWKRFYNTERGKGTTDKYVAAWNHIMRN